MSPDDIIAIFGVEADPLAVPHAAIEEANARRDEMIPAFVAEIERFLSIRRPSEDDLALSPLIVIVHLLAEWRASEAYRGFCRLMRRNEEVVDGLFGDTMEDFAAIATALFDGDRTPLEEVVLDPRADQYARRSALLSLVELALDGRTDRAAVEAFVRACHRRLQPRTDNMVWAGWIEAVAWLGLSDLQPLARKAIGEEKVPYDYTDVRHYNSDLEYAAAHPDAPWPPAFAPRPLPQTAAMLEEFAEIARREDQDRRKRTFEASRDPSLAFEHLDDAGRPAFNPWRDVGRNDPCPCGSGKKFKACCLGKLDA